MVSERLFTIRRRKMFESLSEKMKQNEGRAATTSERAVKWAVIAVASVVVFGGLYFAIQVFA
jgi:hypothetical protein